VGKDGKIHESWKKWFFMARRGKQFLEYSSGHGRSDGTDLLGFKDDGSLAAIIAELLKPTGPGGGGGGGVFDRINVNMCFQAVPPTDPKDKERRKRGSGTWLADLKKGPVFGYKTLICLSAKNGEPPAEGELKPDGKLGPKVGPDGRHVPAVPVEIPPNPEGGR
jgi:hypothetical protein